MTRLAKLQIVGPATVLATVVAAEGFAQALAHAPASEFLWRVNLQLFRAFQKSHYLFDDRLAIPYAQLLLIALPLFLAACVGIVFKRRLLLAAASNLSMIYASAVFLVSFGLGGSTQQAALGSVSWSPHPSGYLLLGVLGCATVSFLISHWIYLRSVYYET